MPQTECDPPRTKMPTKQQVKTEEITGSWKTSSQKCDVYYHGKKMFIIFHEKPNFIGVGTSW